LGCFFLWVLWAEKVAKPGFMLFLSLWVSRSVFFYCLFFLFSPYLLKTTALAPIEVEILFAFFFKKQKIGTDSGK
jgi:hypothetical protein